MADHWRPTKLCSAILFSFCDFNREQPLIFRHITATIIPLPNTPQDLSVGFVVSWNCSTQTTLVLACWEDWFLLNYLKEMRNSVSYTKSIWKSEGRGLEQTMNLFGPTGFKFLAKAPTLMVPGKDFWGKVWHKHRQNAGQYITHGKQTWKNLCLNPCSSLMHTGSSPTSYDILSLIFHIRACGGYNGTTPPPAIYTILNPLEKVGYTRNKRTECFQRYYSLYGHSLVEEKKHNH